VKLLDVKQNTRPKSGKPTYTGVPYFVNVQGPYKNVMTFCSASKRAGTSAG